MKIFSFGLDLEVGKHKYKDTCFEKLVEKFSPQKQSPYIVEFIDDDIDKADAAIFNPTKKLDLILIDLEKIEKRIEKVVEDQERNTLVKAQKVLEDENLLCDADFTDNEKETLKLLQLVTYKPCVGKETVEDIDSLVKEILEKAGVVLFFTAGKKEVHAWSIDKGESILEAAGKIHSDLKRGFIKGEVTNCKDLDEFFNMAEAKSRGFLKIVDRDYVMQKNDIIEIRFNV